MRIAKVTNVNATIDTLKEKEYGYMEQILKEKTTATM